MPLPSGLLLVQTEAITVFCVYWGLTPQQQPGSYQGGVVCVLFPQPTHIPEKITGGEITVIRVMQGGIEQSLLVVKLL